MKITREQLKQLILEQLDELAPPGEQGGGLTGGSKRLGQKSTTRSAHASATAQKAKAMRTGDSLGDVTGREHSILKDFDEVLTAVAEKEDLVRFLPVLQRVANLLRKKAEV